MLLLISRILHRGRTVSLRSRDVHRLHVNGPSGSVFISWVSSSIAGIMTLSGFFLCVFEVTSNGAGLKRLPLHVIIGNFWHECDHKHLSGGSQRTTWQGASCSCEVLYNLLMELTRVVISWKGRRIYISSTYFRLPLSLCSFKSQLAQMLNRWFRIICACLLKVIAIREGGRKWRKKKNKQKCRYKAVGSRLLAGAFGKWGQKGGKNTRYDRPLPKERFSEPAPLLWAV